ncbi:DEAD/DEAH box helicase [Brachybacterium saurashtrense]|uniref:ATP-dependent helicase n=1 Tax=Brachybacterium saurashtrense TaxID=556288 RepID=A0A345YSL1_9MICO|nr:DEAD/DEAH box helicase [Brachybacterium saurashtrense]AXK46913.1 ATP-dependent helicase [Brachybacterium saurashtrense]RRR22628.1 ATP-dependent helicase [Brachybacterium saurashtrense]
MPVRRLHLVLDEDLGPALWVREQTGPGRSRALEDLSGLRRDAGDAVAEALAAAPDQLRHRIRVPGRDGDRRVPALPLEGEVLTGVVGAATAVLAERFGAELPDHLADLIAEGAAVRLQEELIAMPDLVTAMVLDLRAQELVGLRQLRARAAERYGRALMQWRAPQQDAPPLLHALVDAHARAAFAAHLRADPSPAADPLGVLWALADEGELRADLPTRRRLTAAFDAYVDSGRAGVRLGAGDSEVVVRLFPPPVGTAWPLQTCLREADGTVHPVADLRAVGDLTPAGAAEASAAVMRLAPTVRDAAVDETGVDWLLTTAEASEFLARDTPALEEAGVTVLLPRDWTTQKTTLRPQEVEEEPGERSGSGVGLGAVVSFRWRVAVGETELTEEEMEEIREAQSELVRLRGQWVRLDATTLRAAERFLDSFGARTRQDRRQARPGPAGAVDRAPGTPPVLPPFPGHVPPTTPEPQAAPSAPAEVEGLAPWAEMFSLILSPEAADVDFGLSALLSGGENGLARLMPGGSGAPHHPQPGTLQATLRPYQLDGLNWLWALDRQHLGGILADDMGLGKTMQVLALLCREREGLDGEGPQRVGPTLLVCPMSVVGAWQREAARFAPHLAVHVHHGGDRVRDASFVDGAADLDLVITTYSLLARDLPVLSATTWHRLVFDEAQHVKTPGTQVTRAARSLQAAHRLALTGTPVENRLADLHSLMEVVNPGLLGSAASFQERIATPIEEEGHGGAITRLKLVTGPFILRRLKTDRTIISDLPEKIELSRVVNLTPEQAGLYEAIVDELRVSLDGAEAAQRRTLVVSAITRLKQVCNHPAHYLGDGSALVREGEHRSGKLEMVDGLLRTAFEEGHRVLVFTQFTAFGRLLVPHWAERFADLGVTSVPFLHGGVSKRDRDKMVEEFQQHRDRPGVMLLSLRAGGTGLTLTAANHVVHLDRWWNPAVENQATDRAFRIGQRRDVTVNTLVSAGTVEEKIDRVLEDKQALAELTVGAGEDWLAQLDDEHLFDLLSLDEEDDS